MSKSIASHRKPRLSLIAFLTLLLAAVSISFGTIIYSADSNDIEKKQENFVSKTTNLKSILSNNIFLKNSALIPDTIFIVNHNGDSDDVTPGNGICLDSSGNCTLRAAIQEANTTEGTDEIIFALATPAIIQLNPSLSPGELVITKGVTITGPGARLLTVNGVVSSGARPAESSPDVSSGIFNINTPVTVTTTISGMTLSNTEGRGINNDGKLNLSDVFVRGNHYGVYNSGNLNLTRALISNNSKGGIYLTASSTANISNTTITNNRSLDNGAGIHSLSPNVTLNNVTISNNTAVTSGGGLYFNASASGVFVRNTIIANNTAPTGPDILSANSSTFTSRGNNLIGKNNGAEASFPVIPPNTINDQIGTIAAPINPLLGPIQNNGGQTNTRALLTGSPARDAGNGCVTNTNCGGNNPPTSFLFTDQRGGTDFLRNFELGVDIGAFESFYPAPSISSLSPNTRGTGTATFELTINGTNFVADSVVKLNGQDRATIFFSNTQLKAQILAPDVATAGQYPVTVTNPQPGGGVSEAVNFTVANCSYSLDPASQNFTAAGGNGNIAVTTLNGCAWTAVPSASWITINTGTPGTGSGTITFSVAPNAGPLRMGTITVNGQIFNVTQDNGCTFTLSSLSTPDIAAAGGPGSFGVTTSDNGCTWTAVPSQTWITITGGSPGTGGGTVNFTVAPNTGPQRTATITVAGQIHTVTQDNGCVYTLSPILRDNVPAGGITDGSFNVSAGTNCQWTAATTAGWITITSGTGSGNGTVQFTVAPNTGVARTGTITVQGQTFTVNQNAGCSFALSSPRTDVPASGITNGSVNVVTNSGCQWTAVNNAPSWITITGGASGTGNGTIQFTVAPNTGPARMGTITVQGQVHTVAQASGCTFTITPPSPLNFDKNGGTGFFDVAVGAACEWTAAVGGNASWITITNGGGTRTGNGRVNFSVDLSNGPLRTGSINVAGVNFTGQATFTINQANGCTYTLSPTISPILAAGGGPGSFAVTASNSACTWTAAPNQTWITINGSNSGTGSGTVNFAVTANTGPAREGTITVEGQTFTVRQASGCTYILAPSETTFDAAGGNGSFEITTNNQGCTWTAATTNPWITILAPTSGTGNGVVQFTVQANISPARNGIIRINGTVDFTVRQTNGCSISLSSPDTPVPSGGGPVNFSVNSGAGCQWNVQSPVSWIVVTSGSPGSGTGVVTISVAANTGPARSGTINVNGINFTGQKTFTVNQANGCSFVLNPTSTNAPVGGASGRNFTVTTVVGCTWTAVSNAPWITVTNGSSGSGSGTVEFSVQANVSPERMGTITVSGQNPGSEKIHTVIQVNGCVYNISPDSTGINEDGGQRSFNVIAGAGCTWSAVSNNIAWITVTAGAAGSGNGTVTLSIAASTTGEERVGTVTAAGRTFTVNQISLKVINLNDNGIGSLRRAVANANNTPNDDVVTFLPSLAGTITLTTGEITIANSGRLEIRGPGANLLKISGGFNSRIFYINNATVTIKGLTLRDGNGVGTRSNEVEKYGGAIYILDGSLSLERVEIFNNILTVPTGPGTKSHGGGIYYFGGIIGHRIENSTISFNRSDSGAGYFNFGPVAVVNSTFFGNVAKKQGGAIYAVSDVNLRNVTITKNSSIESGHTGAGIMIEGGNFELGNTIIAGNAGPEITFGSGGFLSVGNNLIGDSPGDSNNTLGFVTYNPSDLRDIPPMLATLGMYGGTTLTAALLPGSPAINSANSNSIPTTDQRGSIRTISGLPDIGAFEHNITITPENPILPNATVGVNYSFPLSTSRVDNNDPFAYFEYFSVDGFFPRGMNITRETGIIAGVPEFPGTETITIMSIGTDGMAGAKKYTLTVVCNYSISPLNQPFTVAGGNGTINMTAAPNCTWNTQSSASWITVTNSSGSGNGAINYTVEPNNGAPRSGTITVGGQVFTVNQSGNCTFSIDPTSQNVAGLGGNGSFAVTASNGNCTWSAVSSQPWITFPSGASGTGSGTVNFAVTANTGSSERTGTITVGGQIFTITQAVALANRVAFEFDGDGKSDLAVFRPSSGVWHILGSRNGYSGTQFGITTDKPVAADYDGDGRTDIAVFRDGTWHLLRSLDGYTGIAFGQVGDVPQPGDFDGDGKADLTVFRPSSGVWYILASRDGFSAAQFGLENDKPVAADYDGDGKADIAVYRPETGVWHLLRSRDGYTGIQFGIASDKPVPADYDGDDKTDIAVYRDGIWYLLRSRDGYTGIQFGIASDKPVPADYDGDGKTDIAVYRDGTWHILDSGQTESQSYRAVQFGDSSDIPIPASLQ